MEQTVTEYFVSKLGVGTVVLLIIIIFLLGLVWHLAVKYTKRTMQMDNLPCKKHEEDIDKLAESINGVNVSLGKLETGQEDIHRMISMMASSSSQSILTQSHSPISLTPMGKEIALALGLEKVLDDNWSKVVTIIDDEKNPYDIQMEFISNFIIDPDKYIDGKSLDSIKNDAFRRGVPLIDYMRLLGVMARDRYFKEHGINIDEVDRNDPNMNR